MKQVGSLVASQVSEVDALKDQIVVRSVENLCLLK